MPTQTAPTPMAPSRAHANPVMMAMGTAVQVAFHFCLLPRLQVVYRFDFGIHAFFIRINSIRISRLKNLKNLRIS